MKALSYTYGILFTGLVIMALVCAPHSCEWGNMVYSCFGMVALIVIFLAPFFTGLSKNQKLKRAFGISFLFFAAWVILFMACDFRIMCRLY